MAPQSGHITVKCLDNCEILGKLYLILPVEGNAKAQQALDYSQDDNQDN